MTRRAQRRLGSWAAATVAAVTLLAVACRDQAPPTTGGIIIALVAPPPSPSASTAAGTVPRSTWGPSFSVANAQFTNVHVTLTGPTPRSLDLTQDGANWTTTIDDLEPGSYTITVEGFEGSALTFFGSNANVTVAAGENRTASIPFNAARPTLNAPTSPTTSLRFPVTFSAVQGATEYRIQWGAGTSFNLDTTVTSSPALISVAALGTYSIQGIATIGTRTGGPSEPVTVDVVGDVDSTGPSAVTAAPLGFGGAVNRTLQQLNIVPATDEDWFGFTACAADTLRVETRASRLSPPSALNTVLRLFTGDGATQLAVDDDGASGTDSRLDLALPAEGPYGVQVTGTGGTVGHYTIQFTLAAGPNNTGTACALPIDTILVSPPVHTLRAIGATQALIATAVNTTGDTLTGAVVTWGSSDDLVATVDPATGLVTAVSNGTVTITATPASPIPPAESVVTPRPRDDVDVRDEDLRDEVDPLRSPTDPALALIAAGSAQITVAQATASIIVTPPADTVRFVTDTTRLSASVLDSLGVAVAGATPSWTSADTTIVRVDASGLVTATGPGQTSVSAGFDTVLAAAVLDVIQDPKSLVKTAGDAQSGFSDFQLGQPLTAQVLDSAGFPVPGATVSWSVTSGGGSVSSPTSVTDGNGEAIITWTLGPTAGAQTAQATLGTFTAPFSATAIVGLRWTNVAGGLWSNAANWSTNAVPTAVDTVLIALAGNYTVTIDVNAVAGRLAIGSGTAGPDTQRVVLAAPTLDVTQRLGLFAGGLLQTQTNTVTMDSGLVTGGAVLGIDGGTVNASALFNFQNGNVVVGPAGGAIDVSDRFRNTGTVTVANGTSLGVFTGLLSNGALGTINLGAGSTLDLTLGAANFLGGLTIDSSRTVTVSSAVMSITGAVTISPDGVLDLNGVNYVADSTANNGFLFLNGTSMAGPLHNAGFLGAFSGTSQLSGSVTTDPTSTIEVDGIGTILEIPLGLTNAGTISLQGTPGPLGAVQLDLASALLFNTGTIQFDLVPGTIFAGAFNNDGNVYATTGICCAVILAPVSNTSLISVGTGGLTVNSLVNNGDVMLENGATLTVSSGTFDNAAQLYGTGTILTGLVTNSGIILPGFLSALSFGSLTIDGDLTLGAAGEVRFDLEGTTRGVDLDELVVTGTLTVDGIIGVTLGPAFDSTYGFNYDFVTFGARAGDWADKTALDVSNRHVLRGQYTPSLYRLRVAPPFVVVTPSVDTLLVLGDTVHLTAEARDFSDVAIPGVAPIVWVAVDSGIARVGVNTGIVQARANGTTQIVAIAPGGTVGLADITVDAVPSTAARVVVLPAGATINTLGGTQPFTTVVLNAAGDTLLGEFVVWSTTNATVATADGTGLVTGQASGQTTVTATVGSVVGYGAVTVQAPPALPVNLWHQVTTDNTTQLNGVHAFSPSDAWIGMNTAETMRWDGSTWTRATTGLGFGLLDAWGTESNDLFMAGPTGRFAHYDGLTWTQLSFPVAENARGIWGSAPNDVMAVGDNGMLFRWDGTTLDTLPRPAVETLADIWGYSRDLYYAVGVGGRILRWNGTAWSTMTSPTAGGITGVLGLDSTEAYASAAPAGTGQLLRFNGTWTVLTAAAGHIWTDIAGTHATDLYLAGSNGTIGYWNGTTLRIDTVPGAPLFLEAVAEPGGGIWAVGTGGVVFRGLRGATVTVTPATPRSLVGIGDTLHLTATGANASAQPITGLAVRWTSLNPGVATVDILTGVVTSVSQGTAAIVATAPGGAADTLTVTVQMPATIAVSPGGASIANLGLSTAFTATVFDGLGAEIVGATVNWNTGNANIATIDGNGLATSAGAGQTLVEASLQGAVGHAVLTTAVQGTTPVNLFGEMVNPNVGAGQLWRVRSTGNGNEAWAFGQSGALRFDGANWVDMNLPGASAVYSGWVGGPNDVWATGDAGTLYHWDGVSWDSTKTNATGPMYAVWAASPTNMWAAGEAPAGIEHYDGTGWTTIALPTPVSYLWDIWGTDSGRVFALGGSAGTIYEFDGTNWTAPPTPTVSYRGLWGPGGDSVFAARPTLPGVSIRAGGTWNDMTTPGGPGLYGIWGSSTADIYAVGGAGATLHFDGAVWDSMPRFTNDLVWSVSGSPGGNVYAVTSGGRIYRGVRGGSVSFPLLPDSIFPGDTLRPAIVALDGLSNPVDSVRYFWRSLNSTVATAITNGIVAQDTGTVQIIVTAAGGAADTATLRVGLRSATALILGDNFSENEYIRADFAPRMPGITFDTLSTGTQVPTLAFLNSFDVVLAYQEQTPANGIALGDTLAAYVAGGGNLIITTFRWQGNWGTQITAIEPLVGIGGSRYVIDSVVPPSMALHPLTRGLDTIIGYFEGGVTAAAGAVTVAQWNFGEPAIAYRVEAGTQRLIGISTFPAHGFFNGAFGDETWWRMWENAIRWAAGGGTSGMGAPPALAGPIRARAVSSAPTEPGDGTRGARVPLRQ